MKKRQLRDFSWVCDKPGVLRDFLNNQGREQTVDYRTPLWNMADREVVLAKWDAIYQEFMSNSEDMFTSLHEYELEQREKVGPLSIRHSIEGRLPGIEEYWSEDKLKFTEVIYPGILLLKDEWSRLKSSIRLRSYENVVKTMQLSTNAGLPLFSRRRTVLKEAIQMAKTAQFNYPAVLGWRGQEGGPTPEDTKQRTIFMFPMQVNIAELAFYQPFIEAVQKYEYIPAYVSSDCVDATMTRLFDTKGESDLVIATDFSKMDQHFSPSMRNTASVFYTWAGTGSSEMIDWKVEVWPIKYYIPLLIPGGILLTGEHGMGSGSGGTNADESVAHRALQHQAAYDQGQELNRNSQCLGDDGVLSYPGITVESVVNTYTRYGNVMNPEKQHAATDNTVYLRRWYHKAYRIDNIMKGVYSTYRALGKLMGQERYYDPAKWSKEMVILRSLSILENVKNHPLFYKLVDFVVEGDKYKLGLAIPGFFERIISKFQRAKAELPDAFSYLTTIQGGVNGITDWKVVRYLLSKKDD